MKLIITRVETHNEVTYWVKPKNIFRRFFTDVQFSPYYHTCSSLHEAKMYKERAEKGDFEEKVVEK